MRGPSACRACACPAADSELLRFMACAAHEPASHWECSDGIATLKTARVMPSKPASQPALRATPTSAAHVTCGQQSSRDCPLRGMRRTSIFSLGLRPRPPACCASA